MRTPFLISLEHASFEDYLSKLSSNTRREIRRSLRKNTDLVFEPLHYSRSLVSEFMRLWQDQTVYGKSVEWQFGLGFIEYLVATNRMLFWAAKHQNSGEPVCWIFRIILTPLRLDSGAY